MHLATSYTKRVHPFKLRRVHPSLARPLVHVKLSKITVEWLAIILGVVDVST